jgi:hypothetical protein
MRERIGEVSRHPARIELDRMLIEMVEIEGAAQPVGKVDKGLAAENRWGAATPMQMHDAPSTDRRAHKIDFRPEKVGIGGDRGRLTHRLGGAAAVEAELAAIGDMQVERQCRLRRQRREPRRVGFGLHVGGEMRCGRIGRVTRHCAFSEGQGRAHAGEHEAAGGRGVDRDQIRARTDRTDTAQNKLASWLGKPCCTALTITLRSSQASSSAGVPVCSR